MIGDQLATSARNSDGSTYVHSRLEGLEFPIRESSLCREPGLLSRQLSELVLSLPVCKSFYESPLTFLTNHFWSTQGRMGQTGLPVWLFKMHI